MTDNVTSAPSVGLSAITQEDKSVVSAQKEKTRGGEINICKNLCKHCLLTTEKLWTPHVHPSASHSIKTSAVIISSQQSRGAIYQAASEQSELEVHVSKAEKKWASTGLWILWWWPNCNCYAAPESHDDKCPLIGVFPKKPSISLRVQRGFYIFWLGHKFGETRLRWFRRVQRWRYVVKEHMQKVGVTKDDAKERVRWSAVVPPKAEIQKKSTILFAKKPKTFLRV